MVVAETVAAAKDGAEQVVIDFEPLPCVTFAPRRSEAGRPGAHDEHGSNVCIDATVGDGEATAASFRARRHIAQDQDLDAAHRRLADRAARGDR